MTFHLLASYSLIASRNAIDLSRVRQPHDCNKAGFLYLILGELGVVHVLIELSFKSENPPLGIPTLYQCFFTLPSVRDGNALEASDRASQV
jgi:hypothetical protein